MPAKCEPQTYGVTSFEYELFQLLLQTDVEGPRLPIEGIALQMRVDPCYQKHEFSIHSYQRIFMSINSLAKAELQTSSILRQPTSCTF
jgi:hypothetical protein